MDEKTAMNVEFLRARLLSERIVSKTARQRAEMLSQRVIELEEQLRIVNIQRKKAEKAAEEVLSILETQGITCIARLTDPSTDQENNQLTDQKGNQCTISEDVKEDKFLTSSGMDGSEVDDGLSCSANGSPSDYNCLSWKSHGSSLDSHSQEKLKTKLNRHKHRSSFIVTVKSSQRRPGKSCRKIKRSDIGSASDNELQKATILDAHGDEVVAHSGGFDEKRECPLEASKSKMDKFSVDSSLSFYPDGRNRETIVGGGKDDMDRALEQQAQLIIQFQAMENAQKEWEEKFNETRMKMLDNPEPGSQVSVVENSNCSADNSKLVAWIPQHDEEEKISVKDISFTEDKNAARCRNCEMTEKKVASDKFSSGILSTSISTPGNIGSNGCINGLLNPICESTTINVIETVSKSFTFPPQDGSDLTSKLSLGSNFEKSNTGSATNLKVHSHDQGVHQSSSKKLYAPDNKKILCRLEIPEIRQERPRHPSQSHSLIEEQYDTMTLDETNHATQVFTIPSQESPGLVASRQDLKGSIYEKPNTVIHRNSKVNFPEQGIFHTSLTEKLTPFTGEKLSNKELPEIKELPRRTSRPTSSSLGGVLQSLHRARMSLRQELVRRSDAVQSTLTVASPTNSPIKPDVPIDSSVLFRLPSDSFPQAVSGSNIYGSGLRVTTTRSDLGFTNSAVLAGKEYLNRSPEASYLQPGSNVSFSKDYGIQYPFRPYMDDMSRVQVGNVYVNNYPTTRFVESETVKEYFDRRSNSSISSASATDHPLYYPDLSSKKLSLHNEISKSSSDLRSRKPYTDRYNYGRRAPSPI
ncbi:hypothetical protein IEQ34_002310 [Dendrobium chrysotoxum]|uniref:Uncharacterized protein n=1 Tax=Dendrobium chrysotoxum TaxID=161865 RepID=A0AAV7HLX2_DENCH|nr:hypothetical protein IEQ34_002310 [Dendrobium chrysotoxum]